MLLWLRNCRNESLTNEARYRKNLFKENIMDILKKIANREPLGLAGRLKTSSLQSAKSSVATNAAGSGESVSSSGSSEKSREPTNPTRELMKEAGRRFDEYQKDLDQNFPNDPEGWFKSRVGLTDGLVPPKK